MVGRKLLTSSRLLLLLAVVFVFLLEPTAAFAQVSGKAGMSIHDARIDREQGRIKGLIYSLDLSNLRLQELSLTAEKVYLRDVDSLQREIASADLEAVQRNDIQMQLHKTMRAIRKVSFDELDRYGQLFSHIRKSLHLRSDQHALLAFLGYNFYTSLKFIRFYKHEACAGEFLKVAARNYPADVLRAVKRFEDMPFYRDVVIEAATYAPGAARKYLASANQINSLLLAATEPAVDKLYMLNSFYRTSTRPFALNELVLRDSLPVQNLKPIIESDSAFFKALVFARHREMPYGSYTLDLELSNIVLKRVRSFNDQFESPDKRPLKKAIGRHSDEELYALMVYSQDEILTSTFNLIFDEFFEQISDLGGFAFIERVRFANFRTFLRLLAVYNRLEDFLLTLSAKEQERLIDMFVTGLDAELPMLSPAIDVADALGSMQDAELKAVMKEEILERLRRAIIEVRQASIAVYRLLHFIASDTLEPKDRERLPSFDRLMIDNIVTSGKTHHQLHFFYDDLDGEIGRAHV